jgi:hypothetical protein
VGAATYFEPTRAAWTLTAFVRVVASNRFGSLYRERAQEAGRTHFQLAVFDVDGGSSRGTIVEKLQGFGTLIAIYLAGNVAKELGALQGSIDVGDVAGLTSKQKAELIGKLQDAFFGSAEVGELAPEARCIFSRIVISRFATSAANGPSVCGTSKCCLSCTACCYRVGM